MAADRVAVVSGGSGTVGGGIIAGLLDANFNVVAPVRSDAAGKVLVDEVGQHSNLLVVLADISTPSGLETLVKQLKDNHSGGIDHVFSSCGSWWQKGLLSTVEPHEFNAQLDNYMGGHFWLYKTLISLVKDDVNSSFTFITGGAGQYCFVPAASMVTVGQAGVFGLVLAAIAEQKALGAKKRIAEMRIATFIRRDNDAPDPKGRSPQMHSNRLIGAQAVKLAVGNAVGTVLITDDVLKA